MTTASQTRPTVARTATSVEVTPSSFVETAEDVSRIAERIRAGQAFLKVVAYPWGIEFEVCEERER